MKVKEYFKAGLWTENPVLIQFLGLCPALAITTTTLNAFTMGLCLTLVLIGSNVLIALLRRLIPHHVRIIFYVLIISGLVSLVEMILSTFFNDLYNALGIFVPLIAANGILLARAETFASKNKVLPGMGLQPSACDDRKPPRLVHFPTEKLGRAAALLHP